MAAYQRRDRSSWLRTFVSRLLIIFLYFSQAYALQDLYNDCQMYYQV